MREKSWLLINKGQHVSLINSLTTHLMDDSKRGGGGGAPNCLSGLERLRSRSRSRSPSYRTLAEPLSRLNSAGRLRLRFASSTLYRKRNKTDNMLLKVLVQPNWPVFFKTEKLHIHLKRKPILEKSPPSSKTYDFLGRRQPLVDANRLSRLLVKLK